MGIKGWSPPCFPLLFSKHFLFLRKPPAIHYCLVAFDFVLGRTVLFGWGGKMLLIKTVLGCYKLLYFLISDLLSWLYCSSFCQYPPSSFFKCWCGPDSGHRFMCVRPRDSFVVCRHLTDRKLELVGVVGGCMEKWA